MNKKKIFIFTRNHPYGAGENTFIDDELKSLSLGFDVKIIPLINDGRMIPFDPNVELISELARKNLGLPKKKLIQSFFTKDFCQELKEKPSIVFSIRCMYLLLHKIQEKKRVYRFLDSKNKKGFFENSIIYTFWMGAATSAALDYRRTKKINCKIISKAHGHDLYLERHEKNFIPFYRFNLANLDYIINISNHGKKYLEKLDEELKFKTKVFRLGVHDHGCKNINLSIDNLKFLSCSNMESIKRVDKIEELVKLIAKKYELNVEWTHIGGEKKHTQYINYERSTCTINQLGFLDNNTLLEYYKKENFTFFINLSEDEGIPVSIMEAISFSLPVIATDVGGVSEIVYDNKNGLLFNKELNLENIATQIYSLFHDKHKLNYMSAYSFKVFQNSYNIENNINLLYRFF